MCTAALCAVSSFGALYEIGDFVYTPNGRFQITSENLVTNGDFSTGDLTGWTSLYGLDLSTDTFAVSYDEEIGANCITTLVGDMVGTNFYKSACFNQKVQLEENKTYICSYKTKAFTTPRICSNGWYGRNYNHHSFQILTADGTQPQVQGDYGLVADNIFEYTTLPAEWYTQNMDYSADSAVYCNISFFNLVVDDSYADFGIYEAKQIGDDRKAQDLINLMDFFLENEDFVAGDEEREMLEEAKADLQNNIGTDIAVSELDDIILSILDSEQGPLGLFLDANSADLSGYYTNFTFDGLSTLSAGKGAASGWSTSRGGRWGLSAATNNIEDVYAFAAIGANYALPAGDYYQSASLPAGKYLYVIQALQNKYYQDGSGKYSNFYSTDYNSEFEGLYFFINEDTIQCSGAKGDFAYYYMNVFDVTEDGTQTIGFKYDSTTACNTANTYAGYSGGGRVGFDNVYLRMVGKTAEEVEAYFLAETLADSQYALQVMIDSAKVVILKDIYIFGKDVLQDSIDSSEAIMASLTLATQSNIDYLDAQMTYMRAAIRAYYTLNAEYVTLGEDIETCEADYADESRTRGKETFAAAINVAKTYYENVTAEARDSAELVAQDSVLMAAREVYLLANASYSTPAELTLTNPSFTTGGYTGWTQDGTTAEGAWKFSTSMSDFEGGACAYYNRGYTAYEEKYMYQEVDVTSIGAGVYLYTAEIISNNSYRSDGAEIGYAFLFADVDSVGIYTVGLQDKSQNYPGGVEMFSVVAKVEDVDNLLTPGYMRVGVWKAGGSAAQYYTPNLLYFGSSHFYYYGSIADYEANITGVKVDNNTNLNGDVYNLSGVKVRTNGSIKGLQKGIYIKNGKKYVVK